MPQAWNLFSIGREKGKEDQLTEMLVWLLSAVPGVAPAVIELALDSTPDATEITIRTQYGIAEGRLDAFLSSPSLALVVESKLGSDYDDRQLEKYVEWLAKTHPDPCRRVLMTLTAREAKWPKEAVDLAGRLGVQAARCRWEELHDQLGPLTAGADSGDLPARLVSEFLDMLSEEKLIPVKPLSPDELGRAWAVSRAVIDHFYDFFRACKPAIAEALGADVMNSESSSWDMMWQDFDCRDGFRLAVGLYYTDEGHPLPSRDYLGAPVVWLAARNFEHPDWSAVASDLERHPPDGWTVNPKRWYNRPNIWRPLPKVIGDGSFETQSQKLAEACRDGRQWIESVVPAASS